MDEKAYRLTEKGRKQRAWSRLKFDLMVTLPLIGGIFIFGWVTHGEKFISNPAFFAMPIGLILVVSYRWREYNEDARKWQISLTSESITLDYGERKGSFIKEGPPPVVFQRTEIGEIIELERSVQIVNQSRTAVLEFPKEIESYDEVRSVLEQWKSIPKDPPPVAELKILTRSMVLKYVALVIASIAAQWFFNHPAVIFPAGLFSLFAGFVLVMIGSSRDLTPWMRVLTWVLRFAGVILMASTANRFYIWFGG